MSAFVVSKTHIAAMVRAALEADSPYTNPMHWFAEDTLDLQEASDSWDEYIKRLQQARRSLTWDALSVTQACNMLTIAVVASVKHRYPDDTDDDLPGPRPTYWTQAQDWLSLVRRAPLFKPGAMLKAIACYEYQACELPRWERTEAARFCDALRLRLIRTLPDYENGPWEIEDVSDPLGVQR